MSTISDGTTALPVMMILGWEDEQESANIRHDILGKSEPDFTTHPATTRVGTMQVLMAGMAEGWTLRALVSQGKVCSLVHTELPGASMSFVLSEGGRAKVTLDPTTRLRAVVSIDFTEVVP